jgi:hypothetical protein
MAAPANRGLALELLLFSLTSLYLKIRRHSYPNPPLEYPVHLATIYLAALYSWYNHRTHIPWYIGLASGRASTILSKYSSKVGISIAMGYKPPSRQYQISTK